MHPISGNDFAIAIICALTLEADTVEGVFDETFDRLGKIYGKTQGDANSYITGKIGGHNVVLCSMPGAGKRSAARVTSSLVTSYPKIQLALVVGVCGGAPYPSGGREIFLGDVVVSDAIVEYDFGRQYPGGFQRKENVKNTLKRPHYTIETLLRGLCVRRTHSEFCEQMLEHLRGVQQLDPKWLRPSLNDNLFEASHRHRHHGPDSVTPLVCCGSPPGMCEEALRNDCNAVGCNERQLYAAATGAASAKALVELWPTTRNDENIDFHLPLDLTTVPAIEQFIGRHDDLDQLWEYLQPGIPPSRKVAILHGLGGIGKTQLAIHFARSHKDDYSAILWVSGKDRSTLIQSLSSYFPKIQELSTDLGVATTTRGETEQRADQVLQWLAKPDNSRWLIIFDNIDEYSPLQDGNSGGYDIHQFFPKTDHGSILITSRLQQLVELGRSFPVQRLAKIDAIKLLLQSRGLSTHVAIDTNNEKDITLLVRRLGGLPLAISIAGAFMRETGTTSSEYLQYYQNSWSKLQSLSTAGRHYQQGNIAETWKLSYDEVRKRDPTAAALLLFLAHLDNRDIWYELVRHGNNHHNVPDWFSDAIRSPLAFKTSLKTLIGFSLVETKERGGNYAIHPVVQDWCLHISATENLTPELSELALVAVGYMVPKKDSRDYGSLHQRLMPHANYLLEMHQFDQLSNQASGTGVPVEPADHGNLKRAENMYQQLISRKTRVLGHEHISTLDTTHNLGIIYYAQGRLEEAEEIYERVLSLSPDHGFLPNTVSNLAHVYRSRGKLEDAEKMYQQALRDQEKTLGPDDLSTLATVHSLGQIYVDQGKMDQAEEMYWKALTAKEKILGSEHPSALETVTNLGNLYYNQGQLHPAETMYQRALAGRQKALGPDHISTLEAVNNLGSLFSDQGKLDEAEEMYQRALIGKEKILGPDHESTLSTVNNLGTIYRQQGRLEEAEKMYQQVLERTERRAGPDHISTFSTLNNLGILYKIQGMPEAE
ncbi:hypothetical protein FE257_010085 [Aspergillus nanangensis]|uniref:Uncharacterized protein n=1 Tax=Aspergillus nanangensis TaxID=2582783 RepID=A0AAD4CKY3_ASPNN|nr:hypothetical protein FE257_010085 [Aspergillus nanangensis]